MSTKILSPSKLPTSCTKICLTSDTQRKAPTASLIEDGDADLRLALLLLKQEEVYGTNMIDALDNERNRGEIQRLTAKGLSRNTAILHIFEQLYGKVHMGENDGDANKLHRTKLKGTARCAVSDILPKSPAVQTPRVRTHRRVSPKEECGESVRSRDELELSLDLPPEITEVAAHERGSRENVLANQKAALRLFRTNSERKMYDRSDSNKSVPERLRTRSSSTNGRLSSSGPPERKAKPSNIFISPTSSVKIKTEEYKRRPIDPQHHQKLSPDAHQHIETAAVAAAMSFEGSRSPGSKTERIFFHNPVPPSSALSSAGTENKFSGAEPIVTPPNSSTIKSDSSTRTSRSSHIPPPALMIPAHVRSRSSSALQDRRRQFREMNGGLTIEPIESDSANKEGYHHISPVKENPNSPLSPNTETGSPPQRKSLPRQNAVRVKDLMKHWESKAQQVKEKATPPLPGMKSSATASSASTSSADHTVPESKHPSEIFQSAECSVTCPLNTVSIDPTESSLIVEDSKSTCIMEPELEQRDAAIQREKILLQRSESFGSLTESFVADQASALRAYARAAEKVRLQQDILIRKEVASSAMKVSSRHDFGIQISRSSTLDSFEDDSNIAAAVIQQEREVQDYEDHLQLKHFQNVSDAQIARETAEAEGLLQQQENLLLNIKSSSREAFYDERGDLLADDGELEFSKLYQNFGDEAKNEFVDQDIVKQQQEMLVSFQSMKTPSREPQRQIEGLRSRSADAADSNSTFYASDSSSKRAFLAASPAPRGILRNRSTGSKKASTGDKFSTPDRDRSVRLSSTAGSSSGRISPLELDFDVPESAQKSSEDNACCQVDEGMTESSGGSDRGPVATRRRLRSHRSEYVSSMRFDRDSHAEAGEISSFFRTTVEDMDETPVRHAHSETIEWEEHPDYDHPAYQQPLHTYRSQRAAIESLTMHENPLYRSNSGSHYFQPSPGKPSNATNLPISPRNAAELHHASTFASVYDYNDGAAITNSPMRVGRSSSVVNNSAAGVFSPTGRNAASIAAAAANAAYNRIPNVNPELAAAAAAAAYFSENGSVPTSSMTSPARPPASQDQFSRSSMGIATFPISVAAPVSPSASSHPIASVYHYPQSPMAHSSAVQQPQHISIQHIHHHHHPHTHHRRHSNNDAPSPFRRSGRHQHIQANGHNRDGEPPGVVRSHHHHHSQYQQPKQHNHERRLPVSEARRHGIGSTTPNRENRPQASAFYSHSSYHNTHGHFARYKPRRAHEEAVYPPQHVQNTVHGHPHHQPPSHAHHHASWGFE